MAYFFKITDIIDIFHEGEQHFPWRFYRALFTEEKKPKMSLNRDWRRAVRERGSWLLAGRFKPIPRGPGSCRRYTPAG